MTTNEINRRKKISDGLKQFYQTSQGVNQKKKLRNLQRERMIEYYRFVKQNENNNINNN